MKTMMASQRTTPKEPASFPEPAIISLSEQPLAKGACTVTLQEQQEKVDRTMPEELVMGNIEESKIGGLRETNEVAKIEEAKVEQSLRKEVVSPEEPAIKLRYDEPI